MQAWRCSVWHRVAALQVLYDSFMSEESKTGPSADPGTSAPSILFELSRFVLPILIGLAAAWSLQHWLVLPELGYPGGVRRTIALSESLADGVLDGDDEIAVIISNSAGVEGVDASIVQAAAPEGWKIYNFSINGSNQIEIRMLADTLAEAGADLVIWLMRPNLLVPPRPMHPDVLHAWGFAGFAEGSEWLAAPWIDEASLEQLTAGPWETSLHFRRRWLDEINYSMRRSMRTGIRTPDDRDWVSPYNLELELEGPKLDRHLGDIASITTRAMPKLEATGAGSGRAFITEMAEDFEHRDATLGIIIAPTHPTLDEQFRPLEETLQVFLEDLSRKTGILVGNTGGLLTTDQYADAIHPDAEGRVVLSEWIGRWLPSPDSLKSHQAEEAETR